MGNFPQDRDMAPPILWPYVVLLGRSRGLVSLRLYLIHAPGGCHNFGHDQGLANWIVGGFLSKPRVTVYLPGTG